LYAKKRETPNDAQPLSSTSRPDAVWQRLTDLEHWLRIRADMKGSAMPVG